MLRLTRHLRSFQADEAGSVGLSTFVVVITVLGLLGLGVAGMRTFIGASDLQAASRAGARAAAIQHDFAAAEVEATRVIEAELARTGLACEDETISITPGPGGFEPGGSVVVDLTCSVSFRDLFTPWSSGPKLLTASSTEPVDCLRGGGSDVLDENCYYGG